jgi:hypothetical protein
MDSPTTHPPPDARQALHTAPAPIVVRHRLTACAPVVAHRESCDVRGLGATLSPSLARQPLSEGGHQPRELKFSLASDCVRGLRLDPLPLTVGQCCCQTSMPSAGGAP